VIQNASHVFVPGVVIASGPGVIVFVSREVSPLYPKDKLIYSSELVVYQPCSLYHSLLHYVKS
jgi:hypothetical protein